MTRPKDENGRLLPQAHKRLDHAPALEFAAVTALADDGRLAHLELKRKLVIARKAIDHLTDGDIPPRLVVQKGQGGPRQRRAERGLADGARRRAPSTGELRP